ncbi:glycosidase [Actinomyces sp. 186855]|uniref:glycosidase n=1 Tax=Actinomyces sp. 186855 TaxID=2761164 RepID=UPI0034D1F528
MQNSPLEWWRKALVYEIASSELGAEDLAQMHGVLDHVRSLGLNTVLMRPGLVDVPAESAAVAALAEAAHERGLRLLLRISGALGPVTGPHAGEDRRIVVGREREGDGLLERAEAFLAAGADGIDLGTIIPPEVTEATDLAQLTEYLNLLHGLLASYAEDGVLGADVSADYPETWRRHFQEDWLHHLRDDALMLVRWDAGSMTRHLTRSLAEHDRYGAPPVWRCLPSHVLDATTDPGDGRRWFTQPEVREQRALALQALMLALPGSVYLRQGDEVSLPDVLRPSSPREVQDLVNEHAAEQGALFGSPLATVRHATWLREERRLASAPLAFVTGLDWCAREVLTLLVRDVLVLVNTTAEPVSLPEHAEVLLSSQLLGQADGRVVVPPTTTVWLHAATVA